MRAGGRRKAQKLSLQEKTMTGEKSSEDENAYGICSAAQDTDELAAGFVATQDDLRILVKEAFTEMFNMDWAYFLHGSFEKDRGGAGMRIDRLWAYLGEEAFCTITRKTFGDIEREMNPDLWNLYISGDSHIWMAVRETIYSIIATESKYPAEIKPLLPQIYKLAEEYKLAAAERIAEATRLRESGNRLYPD
jgi:hypothetical protein